MSHSPGPWGWSQDSLVGLYAAELQATHLGDDGNLWSCAACGHEPHECGDPVFVLADSVDLAEEFEANDVFCLPSEDDRRLIAAAPTLLAALQRLVAVDDAHMTIHAPDGDDVARMMEHAEAFDHARALISAVVGETP